MHQVLHGVYTQMAGGLTPSVARAEFLPTRDMPLRFSCSLDKGYVKGPQQLHDKKITALIVSEAGNDD